MLVKEYLPVHVLSCDRECVDVVNRHYSNSVCHPKLKLNTGHLFCPFQYFHVTINGTEMDLILPNIGSTQ